MVVIRITRFMVGCYHREEAAATMHFEHHPHSHIEKRRPPGKTTDELARGSHYTRFNARLAVIITVFVGSMTCAWLFAGIAIAGLPQAAQQSFQGGHFNPLPLVQWTAQTFLQLVLLSVILVGQNIQSKAADKRATDTYNDAEAMLHEAREIQRHLAEQDKSISQIEAKVNGTDDTDRLSAPEYR